MTRAFTEKKGNWSGTYTEPNRVARDGLESSKVWHVRASKFNSHTRGRKRPSHQRSTVRCVSGFQSELNFASDGGGIRRLDETAVQADATNYPVYTRSWTSHNLRWNSTTLTTETSSFQPVSVRPELCLQTRQRCCHWAWLIPQLFFI